MLKRGNTTCISTNSILPWKITNHVWSIHCHDHSRFVHPQHECMRSFPLLLQDYMNHQVSSSEVPSSHSRILYCQMHTRHSLSYWWAWVIQPWYWIQNRNVKYSWSKPVSSVSLQLYSRYDISCILWESYTIRKGRWWEVTSRPKSSYDADDNSQDIRGRENQSSNTDIHQKHMSMHLRTNESYLNL